MTQAQPARIVTFYSYKGGTGRSMALANVAWVLASAGKRVLVIDWDLEAPGLHRYYDPFLADPELTESPGLIDFFIKFASAAVAIGDSRAEDGGEAWFEAYSNLMYYAYSVDYPFPKPGCLEIVPAGRQDETYSTRVNGFNWERFYTVFGGGLFLESVKRQLRSEYDFILIDSRTGVSDTSGICSVQMPDDLVVCFTLNRQSVLGAAAAARSAYKQRLTPAGPTLRVWPVPTRIEAAEKQKRDYMHAYAMQAFQDLLPHIKDKQQYWGSVSIPYQPFYAYEELLAVFGDPPRIQGSVLSSIEAITSQLTDGQIDRLAPQAEATRISTLKRFAHSFAGSSLGESAGTSAAGPVTDLAHRYLCYISYTANDVADSHLDKFVEDLDSELRILTGEHRAQCFFDRRRLAMDQVLGIAMDPALERALALAMEQSNVFLAIVSPSYLRSEWTGRELERFGELHKPVVSVRWVPTRAVEGNADALGRLAQYDLAASGSLDPEYSELGIRTLMRLSRFASQYQEIVSRLAKRILELSASGSPPAGEDPTYRQLQDLAQEYVNLRMQYPSGSERTRLMEALVIRMRTIVPSAHHLLKQLKTSSNPGERLAAIALLQVHPDSQQLEWLAQRLDPGSERPFVGYHAAVALRAAVHELGPNTFGELQRCLEIARASVRGKPDSDRDRTLQLALSELALRRMEPR